MGKIATFKDFTYGQVYTFIAPTKDCSLNQCVIYEDFQVKLPTKYKITITVTFLDYIWLGLETKMCNQYSDICFIGDTNQTPYNFYQSMGDVSNNIYAYNGNSALQKFGFKIGEQAYRIGSLYTYAWFSLNGISNYPKQSDAYFPGYYYIPMIHNTMESLLFSGFTQEINTTTYGGGTKMLCNLPLYINLNPTATSKNNASWQLAYLYYGGQGYHSGYNSPHFEFKYDFMSNNFSMDTKYTKSSFQIIEKSHSSTYSPETDTQTIKKSINILNPVFTISVFDAKS